MFKIDRFNEIDRPCTYLLQSYKVNSKYASLSPDYNKHMIVSDGTTSLMSMSVHYVS